MGEHDKYGSEVASGYFIANESGDILTGVENPNDLKWTMQALMEEKNKRAVIYRNPYQIPRRIAAQFHDDYLVFQVSLPQAQSFADYNDTLAAECIGMFGQFKTNLPGMQTQGRQTNFHERPYKKH